MRIQHNIMAMGAYRNYTNNVNAMKKNLEKLSSGYKINRAGDDAAGLAISEKMRAQITGLETAQKNAKDGISLVQTAEGALTEVHDMLNRMVTLATQSANGTYDNEVDRVQLQKELDQLRTEVDRIADSSNFNGIKLLDGSLDAGGDTVITKGSFEFKANHNGTISDGAIELPATGSTLGTDTVLHTDALAGSDTNAFSIDLHNIKLAAGGKMDIKIGTSDTISIDNSAAGTTDLTAAQIASKIAAADGTDSTVQIGGADLDKSSVTIDGTAYEVKADGTRLTFTQLSSDTTDPTIPKEITVVDPDGGTQPAKADKYVSGALTYTAATPTALPAASQATVSYTDATGTAQTATVNFSANTSASATATGLLTALQADTNLAALFNISGDDTGIIFEAKTAGAGQGAVTNFTISSTGDGTTGDRAVIGAKDTTASVTGADSTVVDSNVTGDYNKSTTVIQTKSDGANARLASTHFTLTNDMVADGGQLTIGNETYTFTTDAKKAGEAGYVVYTEGDSLTKIAEKLTDAAAKNGTYTVGHDGSKITITEVEGQRNFDLTTMDGIEKSLGFKTAKTTPADSSKGLTLQIGDTADSYNQLKVSIKDMHTSGMGIADISIADQASAAKAVDAIKNAINYVSDVRGTLGATQNRLDHTINNLSVMTENIQDAESTIRDTDIAAEMMEYTKNNILIQSAQAMLAQANQVPQGVLQLLQ